jgi:hypothetical protein
MEEKEVPKEEVKKEVKDNLTVDKAEELVKKMEEQNNRREDLLKREEELHAKRILGGQSSAGTQSETPEQKKEMEDKAGALSLLKGTGFEHILE